MLEFKRNRNFIFNISFRLNLKLLLKLIILPFWDLFFRAIININYLFIRQSNKKYNVSICAIFKDEAVYFKEWIEYHKLIGVDHFYLYNNFSSDNFQEILKPYIDCQLVTLIDWPVKFGQGKAYEDCYLNYRQHTNWITFLDIDEFICPKWDLKIDSWLANYIKYPSIAVYWKMFGTSGKVNRSEGSLVIEEFINCWPKFSDVTKVFFNTNFRVSNFSDMHTMSALLNIFSFNVVIPPINEFYKVLKYGIYFRAGFKTLESFTLQINHYWSKSLNDYETRKSIRGVPHLNQPRDLEVFFIHETNNTSSDFTIWRYLIKLKSIINNKY